MSTPRAECLIDARIVHRPAQACMGAVCLQALVIEILSGYRYTILQGLVPSKSASFHATSSVDTVPASLAPVLAADSDAPGDEVMPAAAVQLLEGNKAASGGVRHMPALYVIVF